jgi:hypothetical protein
MLTLSRITSFNCSVQVWNFPILSNSVNVLNINTLTYNIYQKIKLVSFTFIIFILSSIANQVFSQDTIYNYRYTYYCTDRTPKEALSAATKEALVSCLQSKTGIAIQSVTLMSVYESNSQVKDAYFNQLLESTSGMINSYNITDTIQELIEGGVLKTIITLDVTISRREISNPNGLTAHLDKMEYKNNDKASLTITVTKPSYVYIFDVGGDDAYVLIYSPTKQQSASETLKFPDDRFDLVMEKESSQPIEFGSLIVIASPVPVPFAEISKPLYMQPVTITSAKYRKRLADLSNDFSVVYIQYAIE